jgi:membrane protein implicated in regulation of membrane protease activity
MMMFLTMDTGTIMVIVWFALIIFAGVIEASTMDLTSIWFSAGAFFALITAIFWEDNIVLQAIVFIVVSSLMLLGLRPLFKKYIRKNEIKTNADKLIGKIAVCVKPILNGDRGDVKIDGNIWTAISIQDVALDERVEVLAIDGVKLVVTKK